MNTTIQTANDAGHWWNKCNQIHNLLAPYGGIDAFAKALRNKIIPQTDPLYNLFLNPHNGIVMRLSKATATVSLYSANNPMIRALDQILELKTNPGYLSANHKRVPWTNAHDVKTA